MWLFRERTQQQRFWLRRCQIFWPRLAKIETHLECRDKTASEQRDRAKTIQAIVDLYEMNRIR